MENFIGITYICTEWKIIFDPTISYVFARNKEYKFEIIRDNYIVIEVGKESHRKKIKKEDLIPLMEKGILKEKRSYTIDSILE